MSGGRGRCPDSLPPFLPYSFSMADHHRQHTKNWEVTNRSVHNSAMSSDIRIYEETVSQYNPGIYNTNWHFIPPAESTDTRRINSTHLWLPNGKPKSLPKSRMKLLLYTNKVCFNKSTLFHDCAFHFWDSCLNDIEVSGIANRMEVGNQCIFPPSAFLKPEH